MFKWVKPSALVNASTFCFSRFDWHWYWIYSGQNFGNFFTSGNIAIIAWMFFLHTHISFIKFFLRTKNEMAIYIHMNRQWIEKTSHNKYHKNNTNLYGNKKWKYCEHIYIGCIFFYEVSIRQRLVTVVGPWWARKRKLGAVFFRWKRAHNCVCVRAYLY